MCTVKNEDCLLATHISANPEFESACLVGDAEKIRAIVLSEMEKSGLHTKGSNKLRDAIFGFLQGKAKVSKYVGNNVLFFVWNSRMSGTGFAVVR